MVTAVRHFHFCCRYRLYLPALIILLTVLLFAVSGPRVFSQGGDFRPTARATLDDDPAILPPAPDLTPSPTSPPFSDNPGFIDDPPANVLPTAAIDVRATATPTPTMGPDDAVFSAPPGAEVAIRGGVRLQNRRAGSLAAEVTVLDASGTVLGRAGVDPVSGAFAVTVPHAEVYRIVADAPLHRRAEATYVPGDDLPALALQGGDLNEDGCIGPADLAHLLRGYARPADFATDITGDGLTDASDLAILAGNFDPACEVALQMLALTPTATPVPTLEPEPATGAPPVPTGPANSALFADSFDDETGWLAVGGWAWDASGAYSGAGWRADAAARGQVSTLTHAGALDLRAALTPQLTFWQQGALGPGDAVAVDISFDDGASWIAVDRQAGLVAGWHQRAIDLTVCRGQVIGLRFRLETGASPPDDVPAPGFWLDELVILEAGAEPLPTGTPDSAASPTSPSDERPEATLTPTGTAIATGTPPPTSTPEPTFTVTPSATATLTPTSTPTPLPVLLPWHDSFESGQGWLADGAWQRVDPAFQGAGWFANNLPRGEISLLRYAAAIDLTTAVHPRLSFAFRAALAPGDTFAVDVSLDGGISWSAVEQQPEPVTDWAVRDLDLTLYRGYPIRLRFRLDTTGALPEGAPTAGVWIDEVSIQEPPATPVPTNILVPVEPPPPAITITPTPMASSLPPATATLLPVPTAITPLPTSDLIESIDPTLPAGVSPPPVDQRPTAESPS